MKKLFALLLAMVMVFSLAATAFADGETSDPTEATENTEQGGNNEQQVASDGTITINGVSGNTDYTIYKLMDLESFNKESGAYSYKVNAAWENFFTVGAGKDYVTIDPVSEYVSWIGATDDSSVAEFAKLALEHANENDIDFVKSSTEENQFAVSGNTGVFSGLEMGWYLVDSTAGALCGLTTTDKNAVINAKNKVPTIDKQVQEDLGGLWGDSNTADIGQVVEFMTDIHVASGAENYVMHDIMSEGLTFVQDLTDPEHPRGVHEITHTNSAGKKTTLVLGKDYNVVIPSTAHTTEAGTCTFHVEFTENFILSLQPNDRIHVYYNAMLNRYATIDGAGNANQSYLEYGEEHYTTGDTTTTYTFSIDIVKTDSNNKLLDGAIFRIYDALEGGSEVKVVPLMESDDVTPVNDKNGNPMYRRARDNENGVDIVVKDGHVTIVGFDNGNYYLQEIEAPEGYNKLTARHHFNISDESLESIFTDDIYSKGSGVHVVNKTGSMLPETGAMGTTMFIVFGMFAMVATGVLLVTKKRMSMIED